MEPSSILDHFLGQARRQGSNTAALVKRDGKYQGVTWNELRDRARAISRGLVAAGVAAGDRVCILCNTSLEWVLVDMGIIGAGAVTVPIYASNLPHECQYVAEHSDAVIVFAEDAGQVAKLVTERTRLPGVRKVVQMSGDVVPNDGWVIASEELTRGGEAVGDDELERRAAALDADSILTIIYTSGTTGPPKGVVLTHANMLYEAWCNEEIDFLRENDVQLLFLPLAHSYAKVIEIGWLSAGHVMAFAESMSTIKDNLGEVRPTVMCGVPRIYEKFYAAVVEKGQASSGLKRRLFAAAMDLSRKNGEAELRGDSLGAMDALKLAALKRLVFSKIGNGVREVLGGRMRALISGGAPLPRTVAWFMRDAGVDIAEGYGLTETSAATCVNRPGSIRIGTVGPPVPGTEIRIAEDGEVLIKGRGVMREYWKDPGATAAVLADGWFHTGDIGNVDDDGYVSITDRKKDIIVTAGGKNITPQNIETMIKAHELVSHVVVHGDRRKYLTALITVDADALGKLRERLGIEDAPYAELCRRPEVVEAIQAVVDECNARLRSVETIKRFKVLEEDFSQEGGELTPKLSIKRKVVCDKYRAILDELYDEQMLA